MIFCALPKRRRVVPIKNVGPSFSFFFVHGEVAWGISSVTPDNPYLNTKGYLWGLCIWEPSKAPAREI